MDTIAVEPVKVEELAADWRARRARHRTRDGVHRGSGDEVAARPVGDDGLLFGMWRDREDMAPTWRGTCTPCAHRA